MRSRKKSGSAAILNYNLPQDWMERVLVDWPIVANVIPPDQQVLKRDRDKVLAFANEHRAKDNKRGLAHCFDYAAYQLDAMKLQASGPTAFDHDSMMLVHEHAEDGGRRSEVQVYPTLEAIEYLKSALLAETPVLIGVRLYDWYERPNKRGSTLGSRFQPAADSERLTGETPLRVRRSSDAT